MSQVAHKSKGRAALVALLDSEGMSKGDLADAWEIHASALSRILKGERQPTLEQAKRLEDMTSGSEAPITMRAWVS